MNKAKKRFIKKRDSMYIFASIFGIIGSVVVLQSYAMNRNISNKQGTYEVNKYINKKELTLPINKGYRYCFTGVDHKYFNLSYSPKGIFSDPIKNKNIVCYIALIDQDRVVIKFLDDSVAEKLIVSN